MELADLRAWLHENCGCCQRRGDRLWINLNCGVASRIVWNGPPYSESDEEFVQRLIRGGRCRNFVLGTESVQERERKEVIKRATGPQKTKPR